MIYFYEQHSDELYRYFTPAPSRSTVNIPFFVSRGYLVFTPDIHYTVGQPGEDAYNAIVSGAEALAKNRWVDNENMAIQGQSWGLPGGTSLPAPICSRLPVRVRRSQT